LASKGAIVMLSAAKRLEMNTILPFMPPCLSASVPPSRCLVASLPGCLAAFNYPQHLVPTQHPYTSQKPYFSKRTHCQSGKPGTWPSRPGIWIFRRVDLWFSILAFRLFRVWAFASVSSVDRESRTKKNDRTKPIYASAKARPAPETEPKSCRP
jgi:hypothetical protein